MPNAKTIIHPRNFDGVLFDLDGVVTKTASVHGAAWKLMFDGVLKKMAGSQAFVPFDLETDYPLYVDGKPRIKGIEDFLASRNIVLDPARDDDRNIGHTLEDLGRRKNKLFLDLLEKQGVKVYPSTLDLVDELKKNGFKTGVVSSSENCVQILKSAKIETLFDVRVDGVVAQKMGLLGKPSPQTFLEAARQLGVEKERNVQNSVSRFRFPDLPQRQRK
ncbi:MAG: HAD hydrolase-like protein [Desulfobacter sp.]|nr:HAD hydrolase-like protein [Desulfobacter sp.]WDP84498.1 MAG: HAD hydrolase-like protein [Desulfobacter sp.]